MMQDYMFKKANRAAFDTISHKRSRRFWLTVKIIIAVIALSAVYITFKTNI